MPLTDKECKAAKPKAKPYKLADGYGLYLEVFPSGAKYWRLKYRFLRKEKRLAFGVYPEVSLLKARAKRDDARNKLRDGIDPSMARQDAKRQALTDAENTFEVVAREWHSNRNETWSDQYGKNILQRLETDIFPGLQGRPIKHITALELLGVLKKMEDRGIGDMVYRLLAVCKQIFRYAIVTGKVDRNIAADLKGALKPVQRGHFAALAAKDLPAFMQSLDQNDACLQLPTRHAAKLMVLTFVRTSELIKARWEEFDLDASEWVIPAERMKMRKSHIVPLSRQALEILKAQKALSGKSVFVFPNRSHPTKTMSNNTILKALSLMGYKGKATGHGFRALAMSTIMEKLKYRYEVIDRQLAHGSKNQVDAAYNRAEFLEERKKMMQEWADYIEAVTAQNNIVQFKKAEK